MSHPPRNVLFALLATLVSVACREPESPRIASEERIPGADLLADVTTVRVTFEALHPGLRRYNSDEQLARAYGALETELRGGATLAEAYRAFAIFSAKIRCGHTFLNPTNQSKRVQDAIFEKPRLPFLFRWVDRRMIVTRALTSEGELVPGTEITHVDGVTTTEIMNRILSVARADGSNDAKRLAQMERRGLDRFEPFDIAFDLFFPKRGDHFALDLVGLDGKARRVLVRGVQSAPSSKSKDSGDGALWNIRYLEGDVAYLRMPTWVAYDTKWDWRSDIQHDFDEIEARGSKRLVVDLRGNEGGSDVGNEIIAHYVDQPLAVEALEPRTRYRRVPEQLRQHLKTWDASFFDWGDYAIPRGDGFFHLTRWEDAPTGEVITKKAPRSHARLIVLVDGANSSATFQFAEIVQKQHLGLLVGEPTGGNQRGINGGAFFFLTLPKSGLEIDLPLVGRFGRRSSGDELPDAGLIPDVSVSYRASDFARDRDPQLEAALSLTANSSEH